MHYFCRKINVMKIFKFGGASVNSAQSVRNVAGIIARYSDEELVLVFSAMGKTTNALERVVNAAYSRMPDASEKIDEVKQFHLKIINELFGSEADAIISSAEEIFEEISKAAVPANCGFDEYYDRVVSLGEILSTTIVGHYLQKSGITALIIPARELIITNSRFRDASVDWEKTGTLVRKRIAEESGKENGKLIITQGFIGSTTDGRPTTLGREGSDFTASILAYCLNAEEVNVWKDVEGLLNADPDQFAETIKIDEISFHEVIELAFFGAKILHPKTIKPLQNKSIPLRIKSFFNPVAPGTLIDNQISGSSTVPFLIKKSDQTLISFFSRDFSFIAEDKLSRLFGVFNRLNIKINLMQNSAISFTIITNDPGNTMDLLLQELKEEFDVLYNRGLELLTIRNFTEAILEQHLEGKNILLEQRSRKTIQVAYLQHQAQPLQGLAELL